jgi:hypothetical protein
VVRFQNEEQAFVLNQTNATTISEVVGSDDLDAWTGAAIVLFATTTDFAGRQVDCVRCRAPKQKKTATAAEPPAARQQQQLQELDDADDLPF